MRFSLKHLTAIIYSVDKMNVICKSVVVGNKEEAALMSVMGGNLRSEADPEVTFWRANVEYWARARARWAAAVSTAEMLRKPPTRVIKGKRSKQMCRV